MSSSRHNELRRNDTAKPVVIVVVEVVVVVEGCVEKAGGGGRYRRQFAGALTKTLLSGLAKAASLLEGEVRKHY